MSMSEFDRQAPGSEDDLSDPVQYDDKHFPADFSEADAIFAQELEALFSLDEEEVPPFFAQTLLEAEKPGFQPVEYAFEKKTSARVFRQLKLKRRLFRSASPSLGTFVRSFASARPFIAVSMMSLCLMMLTVIFTGTSFAAGLNYLWSGAHSGVLQVQQYPEVAYGSHTSSAQKKNDANSGQMNLLQAQHLLKFPMLWPQYMPTRYVQNDIYLYREPTWADGPILILNFSTATPGEKSRQIAIWEFKPQGTVLDVVQDGAARQIMIGRSGLSSAIYVEGQWTQAGSSSVWVYNGRSQLISETDGVVFWIVGDKRDGIDGTELSSIASSLTQSFNKSGLSRVTESDDGTPWFLTNDVIYLSNPDNPDGPSFTLVGGQQATSAASSPTPTPPHKKAVDS